jgi:hypothetical protein
MAALLGLSGSVPPTEPEPAPVVGGIATDDDDGPIVGLVDGDGAVVCTGIAIDPRWVLTAGHCAGDGVAPTEAWWGADLRGGSPVRAIAIAGATLDPDHDLALLELGEPADGDIAALAIEPPIEGDPLRAVGYGATTDGGSDGGLLRAGPVDVLAVERDTVRTWSPAANFCSGDSGGPLAWPGTGEASGAPLLVVGVASTVDPSCVGGAAVSTRVDAAWRFLAGVVPDLAGHPLPEGGREDDDDGSDTADTGGRSDDAVVVTPRERRGCAIAPISWAGAPWLGLLWAGALALARRR